LSVGFGYVDFKLLIEPLAKKLFLVTVLVVTNVGVQKYIPLKYDADTERRQSLNCFIFIKGFETY
jgi:hypothetical protein